MHKKSVETPGGEQGRGGCLTPPTPIAEKWRAKGREKESLGEDAEFSCQKLKENSIAALRAKAQEHSTTVLRGEGGRAGGQEEELNSSRK